MKTYFAIVEPGDSKTAHGIRFPDLPNVYAAADADKDILRSAQEALQLWAEDEDMPDPSEHTALVARDDVRAELAVGGYLIAVPFIEKDTAVVRANVSFERGLLKAIDTEAKARGLTRAAFLASAARHEIEGLR